jgi:hypothetical protein
MDDLNLQKWKEVKGKWKVKKENGSSGLKMEADPARSRSPFFRSLAFGSLALPT